MRQRLALEPDWIPEPPQDAPPRRDLWPLALQASIALAVAAGAAWVVVSVPQVTQLGRSIMPTTSSETRIWTSSRSAVPPSGTISPDAVRAVAISPIAAKAPTPQPQSAAGEPAMRDATERADTSAPAPAAPAAAIDAANVRPPADLETALAERARRVSTREGAAATPRAAPDFVTRQLDHDELASMLRRAGDFIKSGDLSSARLLLRRAAEAGSEEAALTLAGTFDPNVLAARGFQDGAADIALARLWYERAAQFGSSEAPRRLRQLANNSPQ
jgi:TPR repeat protein